MMRSVFVVLVVAVLALYSCEAAQCRGGPDDIMTECGSHCEPSCSNPGPRMCIMSCALNVCRCRHGTYRRESDQQCVTIDKCH